MKRMGDLGFGQGHFFGEQRGDVSGQILNQTGNGFVTRAMTDRPLGAVRGDTEGSTTIAAMCAAVSGVHATAFSMDSGLLIHSAYLPLCWHHCFRILVSRYCLAMRCPASLPRCNCYPVLMIQSMFRSKSRLMWSCFPS